MQSRQLRKTEARTLEIFANEQVLYKSIAKHSKLLAVWYFISIINPLAGSPQVEQMTGQLLSCSVEERGSWQMVPLSLLLKEGHPVMRC